MEEQVQFVHYREGEYLFALVQFYNLAQHHVNGAARVAARLLLNQYNGDRFQFDLTDLRLLDAKHLAMAFALMDLDAKRRMEVHARLDMMFGRSDFGARFEHLAHKWKLKGRCKKEWLQAVAPIGELRIGGAA